ncbi:alanine and arginine-rich domain-containing protein-like [Narcine bancroftii]|uniref:alanine and arginine-rich domain-containing protein-like n=1 Tax=Narcine bancroftii TaxID=1343680 RepID=UPI0038316E7B
MPGSRLEEERQEPAPAKSSDMDLVLKKLKDFSTKASRFAEWDDQPGLHKRQSCPDIGGDPQSKRQRADLEKGLERLKSELMEMRSQNQSLAKQLMELHEGIQDLKQEHEIDRVVNGSENYSSNSEDDSCLNHSQPRLSLQAATLQKHNRRNSLP